jgi:hypothetical protein
MGQGEAVLIDGTGSQSTLSRWGDYSSMNIDPVDDCTFWYTNQYQTEDGVRDWHTRVGAFRIGPCQQGPAVLASLGVNPTLLEGGNPATGVVLLTNLAPAGGASVALSSSNASIAMVPSTVTVPEGKTSATFPIATSKTPVQTDVTVTGVFPAGVTHSSTFTIRASPLPSSITFSPDTVMAGNAAVGTVTLDGPALAGGVVVALSTDSPTIVRIPSTLAIPAGSTSGTFT